MQNEKKSGSELNTDSLFLHPKNLPVKRSFGSIGDQENCENKRCSFESEEPAPKLSCLG